MIGFIYKITPHKCEEFYIGSTEDMKYRKNKHTQAIKSRNQLVYKTIRECGGFDMELIYEQECDNNGELKQEEQRALDKYQPKLNMVRAFSNEEDKKLNAIKYRKDNREKLRLKNRDYTRNNKEKLQLKYQKNKEAYILKQQQYYQENKEAIREKNRQYHHENKEANNEKCKNYRNKNIEISREKDRKRYHEKRKHNNPIITCDCGKQIKTSSLPYHITSKYHINYLNQLPTCDTVLM